MAGPTVPANIPYFNVMKQHIINITELPTLKYPIGTGILKNAVVTQIIAAKIAEIVRYLVFNFFIIMPPKSAIGMITLFWIEKKYQFLQK
jgi:hypothetical protein